MSSISARHRLPAWFLLTAIFALASPTSWGAVTFKYSGICQFNCPGIGLSFGDAVSGTLSIADAAIAPNAPLDSGDVVSFAFDFGSVHATNLNAFAFTLVAEMDAAGDELGFIVLVAGTTFDPNLGDGFALGPDFRASKEAFCKTASCDELSTENTAEGPGTFVRLRDDVTTVPEPAALLLLLPVLPFVAWRARAARSQRITAH